MVLLFISQITNIRIQNMKQTNPQSNFSPNTYKVGRLGLSSGSQSNGNN